MCKHQPNIIASVFRVGQGEEGEEEGGGAVARSLPHRTGGEGRSTPQHTRQVVPA